MFRIEDIQDQATVQTVAVNGERVTVEILKVIGRDPFGLLVRVEDRIFRIVVEGDEGNGTPIRLNGKRLNAAFGVGEAAGRAKNAQQLEGPIVITAPMSGRIASLKAEVGGRVEEGQSLVILEAMKMENEIACPRGGIVKAVYVRAGALVRAGDKLALIE